MSRSLPLVLVLSSGLVAVACGGGEDPSSAGSDWVHTTTTEGDRTIVATASGSVWGGEAGVHEELSIGQLEGADEYAFARISEVWATDDEVYVADGRLPAVRVFDHQGTFLREIGRPGQGPGEFESPQGVATFPDGRVVVYDGVKLLVYESDGTFIEQWGGDSGGNFRFSGPDMTAVGEDGAIYVRTPILPEDGMAFGRLRWGMTPWLPDGTQGEMRDVPQLEYERPSVSVSVGGGRAMMPVPFSPSLAWTMLPDGRFVVGVADEYSFEVREHDGTVTEVRRQVEPVPVNPDEVTLEQREVRIVINNQRPEIDWGDAEIPAFKPAFDNLVATRDGRILVLRSGPATVDPACLDPNVTSEDIAAMDCTDGVSWADLFEADGTFLGSFEVPDGVIFQGGVHIDGLTLWVPAQDELGAVTVKRLRILPPGEEPAT